MPARSRSYARTVVLERCFGLGQRNMTQRGVSYELIDGVRQYDLEEIAAKCPDLIIKNLSRAANSGVDCESHSDGTPLRDQETIERILKLRLDNQERAGELVSVEAMRLTMGRKVREVADILDTIPTAVKMGCPDIPQAALEVVARSVAEIRNKVAEHEVSES